jgi:serine/threonine-protein phosphatase PP1-1
MAKDPEVPQPGPARLSKGAGPDEWLEQAKQADMKRLCEIVKECLMEGE